MRERLGQATNFRLSKATSVRERFRQPDNELVDPTEVMSVGNRFRLPTASLGSGDVCVKTTLDKLPMSSSEIPNS